MKQRAYRIVVVIGVLAAALALSLGAALSHEARGAVSSTIHAYFDADGHLMFTYLDGTQVAGTIPPGTYSIVYDNLGADDLAVDHAFHLSGPNNVNFAPASTVVQTTLSVTFVAGATYTLQDDLHPTLERRTFIASTTPDTSTTTVATTTTPPKSTTKPVSNDVVGADIKSGAALPLRGTLAGAVSAAGKLSLLFKGKAVGQLKAGRYTFVVDDKSSKTAFKVQRIKKSPVTVTGGAYVGRNHKVTVPLDAGQWWFFSGAGKKTFFIVIK